MATRTDQLLKAMRGYLEHLGNMPLTGRITNAAVFEDVYRFLLNGFGGWNCAALTWPLSVSSFGTINTAAML